MGGELTEGVKDKVGGAGEDEGVGVYGHVWES